MLNDYEDEQFITKDAIYNENIVAYLASKSNALLQCTACSEIQIPF
jgi:hypothetical protein